MTAPQRREKQNSNLLRSRECGYMPAINCAVHSQIGTGLLVRRHLNITQKMLHTDELFLVNIKVSTNLVSKDGIRLKSEHMCVTRREHDMLGPSEVYIYYLCFSGDFEGSCPLKKHQKLHNTIEHKANETNFFESQYAKNWPLLLN